MRWPWQRREQEVAPQPALPPRQDDAPRVSPMGWAFLPPLQRQLGDMPLVARTASFPSQLPAWQNPSFTGTLAHRVSTDAPSGVIDGDGGGTGEPTLHSASPDLTLLAPTPVRPSPVQRAVASASSSEDGSRAVPAPLTTAAPTGLPVRAVQSFEAPTELPDDVPSEVATDEPAADVSSETGHATGESSAQTVADPSTPPPSMVQRSTGTSAPGSTAASPMTPTSPTLRARPSVGGRRLGLGAPLPAMPLASDVPPVQRDVDVPPALGSEGADGFVEVDIPSKPKSPERPAETVAEPDVPTLGPAPSRREEGLEGATTPDTASPTPPAMPVAPVQRSLVDTTDTTAPEPVESTAEGSTTPAGAPAPSKPAESHTEPTPGHDVPARGTLDGPAEGSAPTATPSSVPDRPVLAQRSIATPSDTTPASSPRPGGSPAPANDAAISARELRHAASHPAAATDGPQLQRAVVGPAPGGAAGLTLQRSVGSPSPVPFREESTTSAVPDVPMGDAPDRPTSVETVPEDVTLHETVHPEAPPPVVASTRPMLGTAAPLTSLVSAPVQRAEDTTEVRNPTESRWSTPMLARTPGQASTMAAQAPQLRTARHPVQLPDVQRAAAGGRVQRSVDPGNGSATRYPATASMAGPTRSQESPFYTATSAMPLAAQSHADESAVQRSLAEDPAADVPAVPDEAGAAVPAETREAGGAAATSASPGADAAGGAGASSPEQLEALAGRLFAPLMRRIRSEMLLDRERRGLRTDSW